MSLLQEYESLLAAGIQSLLPAHLVLTEAGDLPAILGLRTIACPAAIVRIAAWEANGEGIEWSVVLLDDTAAPPDSRRAGILEAVAILRAAVRGMEGRESLGGRFIRTEPALLAWEERWREADPLAPGFAPPRRMALAAALEDGGALVSGAFAEDTHFDELDGLPAGARILAWHESFGARDLGITFESEPERHDLVLPLEVALPAGTRLAAVPGPVVLPRGTRVSSREDFADWRVLEPRLDGRLAAGLFAPRSHTRTFTLPGPAPAIEALLSLAESQAQFLHLDGAGGIHAFSPLEYSTPVLPSDAARPVLHTRAWTVRNLDVLMEGL